MALYWTRNSIPALRGLDKKQREAAVQSVVRQVWRHWQVWLPFVLQTVLFVAAILWVPPFPHRWEVILLGSFVALQFAALPFHHYLQYYLSRKEARQEPPVDG